MSTKEQAAAFIEALDVCGNGRRHLDKSESVQAAWETASVGYKLRLIIWIDKSNERFGLLADLLDPLRPLTKEPICNEVIDFLRQSERGEAVGWGNIEAAVHRLAEENSRNGVHSASVAATWSAARLAVKIVAGKTGDTGAWGSSARIEALITATATRRGQAKAAAKGVGEGLSMRLRDAERGTVKARAKEAAKDAQNKAILARYPFEKIIELVEIYQSQAEGEA